jgi:hypothetical protein
VGVKKPEHEAKHSPPPSAETDSMVPRERDNFMKIWRGRESFENIMMDSLWLLFKPINHSTAP